MKNEHTWIKNIPEARIVIGYNEAWFLANRGSIFFLLPRRHRTCRLHSHFFLTLRFSRTKDDLHSNTTSTIQADSCKWRTFRSKLFIFLFRSPFYYFSLISILYAHSNKSFQLVSSFFNAQNDFKQILRKIKYSV